MTPERRAELIEKAAAFDLDDFCRDMEALREQYAGWHSDLPMSHVDYIGGDYEV